MKEASVLVFCALLGSLGGCDEGDAETPLSSESAPAETASAELPEADPLAEAAEEGSAEEGSAEEGSDEAAVVTAADFEADANEDISLENLEQQVGELEAQLNQDLGTDDE